MSTTPRNHYSRLWLCRITSKTTRHNPRDFAKNSIWGRSRTSTNRKCLEKMRARKSLESVLSDFEDLEYGSNICQNMKRKSWNFPFNKIEVNNSKSMHRTSPTSHPLGTRVVSTTRVPQGVQWCESEC